MQVYIFDLFFWKLVLRLSMLSVLFVCSFFDSHVFFIDYNIPGGHATLRVATFCILKHAITTSQFFNMQQNTIMWLW